jgi:hypothetical protein
MYGPVYGTGPRGADVYKNRRGFFYVDYDPVKGKEFKAYMPKKFKPEFVCKHTRKSVKCSNIKTRRNRRHRA